MPRRNKMWRCAARVVLGCSGFWLLLCLILPDDGSNPLATSRVLGSPSSSNSGQGLLSTQVDAAEERWRKALASLESCATSPEKPTWDEFFDFLQDRNNCSNLRIFGGKNDDPRADGAKGVCFESVAAPRSEGCLVLSFGINNEWSFDDAMADFGCNVYSFDPTMEAPDHQRSSKISFHSLGLGGRKDRIWVDQKRVPVDTYRGVLEGIGMNNRTIDYLKIDIEGSEIDFFENVLFEDPDQMQYVSQIGMEIHVGNSATRDKLWEYFGRIRCLGFRMVFSEMNIHGQNSYMHDNRRKVSTCYEMIWLKQA